MRPWEEKVSQDPSSSQELACDLCRTERGRGLGTGRAKDEDSEEVTDAGGAHRPTDGPTLAAQAKSGSAAQARRGGAGAGATRDWQSLGPLGSAWARARTGEMPFKTPAPAAVRLDGSGGGGAAGETRCERAGPTGPSREGRRGGEDMARELWGPPPLLRSCSPIPAGRIGKFACGQGLGGETDCAGTEEAEGKARGTDSGRDREGDTQGETEGTLLRAENGVRGSEQPKESESAQNSEFRGGKRGESRGQKRAAAETEALARGDAGTRRERFGSVTVLPHLEDITSPLKKK